MCDCCTLGFCNLYFLRCQMLQPAAVLTKYLSKISAFRVTTLGNLGAILEKIKFNI